MATDPVRMVNGTIVIIPSNGANVIQAGQGMPGVMIQPPGMVQYVGQQQYGSPSSQSQQTHLAGPLEKLQKVETKTLGAIQIIIGLLHIGLGGVSIILFDTGYTPLASYGGYPFWGGLFFIISGSLSVSTAKDLSFSLVKCTVGLNITSALMAFTGIALEIIELVINSVRLNDAYYVNLGISEQFPQRTIILWSPGIGVCVLLLLFSMLEFCITISTAHFGCQAACCHTNASIAYVPYPVQPEIMTLGNNRGNVASAEGNSFPPAYDDTDPFKNEGY